MKLLIEQLNCRLCHKIKLSLLFLSFVFAAKAQNYVSIPDSSFVVWLNKNYPVCMNGNLMDTSCMAIKSALTVNVNSRHIKNLYGIQFFNSLDTLLCRLNQLSILPPLPKALTYLNCEANGLNSLVDLPPNLSYLLCSNNNLTGLPELPHSLRYLWCYNNQLSSLPVLPITLLTLDCSGNQLAGITKFPGSLLSIWCNDNLLTELPVLPPFLGYLNCNRNLLVELPNLPGNLFQLECKENKLSNLPVLPESLRYLFCSMNKVKYLPVLPDYMMVLHCANNGLTYLPQLPEGLNDLNCAFNDLSGLPALPKFRLKKLNCSNNRFACFPLFPETLMDQRSFDISNNPFKCIPNYVPAMDSVTRTFPVCDERDTVNNPNGCGLDALASFSKLRNDGMDIYPNPGSGIYYLNSGHLNSVLYREIEIFNAMGMLVMSTCIKDELTRIDLSNQQAGIFIVRLSGNGNTCIKKIVKQ